MAAGARAGHCTVGQLAYRRKERVDSVRATVRVSPAHRGYPASEAALPGTEDTGHLAVKWGLWCKWMLDVRE